VKKDIETEKISEIKAGKVNVEYDDESNCLIKIKHLEISPLSELWISFGVRKILLPFEEYPNDPNRGFNIP